jgi:hypothetical protein
VVRLADLEGRRPRIDTHPVAVHQHGELLQLDADRALPPAEGSYTWHGELRLWDNEALMGWYHLERAVAFWSAALDATEEPLAESSRHVYRRLRLPARRARRRSRPRVGKLAPYLAWVALAGSEGRR